MRSPVVFLCLLVTAAMPAADEFQESIRPVLVENCSACHDPDNPKQKIPFLRAQSAADVAAQRGLWGHVAEQLHNRTMPPAESKLTEEDRFRIGLGAVLAMTSHFEQTSPVLRGAYVLETLMGANVPRPPPDVPPLETAAKSEKGLTVRQMLARRREDPSCSACHNMIDPIGFGLENFDWLGRWRTEDNGQPVDAAGEMPTGEKFDGPAEMREILLGRQDEFVRHLTGKDLGYALGRSLLDADQCLVQQLADGLADDGLKTRTLIREVVLSKPFRYTQSAER